jgi:hypothetical protein
MEGSARTSPRVKVPKGGDELPKPPEVKVAKALRGKGKEGLPRKV